MNDTTTFPAGTNAECNRCKRLSPLPKDCRAHIERERPGMKVYRLETMCTLENCGHMDAHWVIRRIKVS
jgi:hypothetical protein